MINWLRRWQLDRVQKLVNQMVDVQKNDLSDGCHTFGELYDHRCVLWIFGLQIYKSALEAQDGKHNIWRSLLHSDGSAYSGWFLLGCGYYKGSMMTYHLPMKYWDLCGFAETLEHAPEFDGHTSADVLERLKKLIA